VQVSEVQVEAGGGVRPDPDELTAEAASERLLEAAVGAVDLAAVYLGDRLGWYASLRDDGPATSDELAVRTGTAPRYAREWLEQQAVTGWLKVEDDGRFRLPAGVAEAFTDPASLAFVAPLSRMLVAPVVQMPALLEAYRSGGGVSWGQLGADARESQADINRPWYEKLLAAAGPASRSRAPTPPPRSPRTTSIPTPSSSRTRTCGPRTCRSGCG
jgi:hypothetical protein